MTAFASVLIAALPGVGAPPEKVGTGGSGGAGGAPGVFDALLESMTGAAGAQVAEPSLDADARKAAANDAQPIDPALAAASGVVLPFAPLTQASTDGEPATAAVGDGAQASAVIVPFLPVLDPAQAADVAARAQNDGAALGAAFAEAKLEDASAAAVSAEVRVAADAMAKTGAQSGAPSASAAPAQTPQPAAPQAEAAAQAQVMATAAADASAATPAQVEAPPPSIPIAQTSAPRTTTSSTEGRRAASAVGKSDQIAVSAYLDGLDQNAAPFAPDVADAVDGQPDTALDPAVAPTDFADAEQPEGQAPAAELRAAQAQTTLHDAPPPAASRASAETVAKLSADIVRKLDGQSSRFDLQLDPHGLGKVDVSIEIDRDGRLTAALSFESAQAASDLRSRSGDLRAALEQAGFDVSDSGLSFSMASENGAGGRQADEQTHGWSGRAFQTAQLGLDEADVRAALKSRLRAEAGGVDIRI